MSCRAAAALLYRQGGRENLLKALDDLGYTCRNLGDLYKAGHPYQDLEKALKLYQKAYDIFREADCRKQTTESMENVQICQECLADICFVAGLGAKKCPDPKYSDWISFCENELKELEEEEQ